MVLSRGVYCDRLNSTSSMTLSRCNLCKRKARMSIVWAKLEKPYVDGRHPIIR